MFVPYADINVSGEGSSTRLGIRILTSGIIRGVLHSVQVFHQLSESLSNIAHLIVRGLPRDEPPPDLLTFNRISTFLGGPSLLGGMGVFGEPTLGGVPLRELPGVGDRLDRFDWLDFLRPFTAVRTLNLRGELTEDIVHALEWVRGDMIAEILPNLQTLYFFDQPSSMSTDKFVSLRQNSGRPVTVNPPESESDNMADSAESSE